MGAGKSLKDSPVVRKCFSFPGKRGPKLFHPLREIFHIARVGRWDGTLVKDPISEQLLHLQGMGPDTTSSPSELQPLFLGSQWAAMKMHKQLFPIAFLIGCAIWFEWVWQLGTQGWV